MHGEFWHITQRDKHQRIKNLCDYLTDLEVGEFGVMVQVKTGQRTTAQNNAMHGYFNKLAAELNAAGLDMRTVLKPGVEISWSTPSVKDFLWRPIQKAVTGKTSTTELQRNEVSEVYEHLSRHLGSKFGIWVPFPSRFGE